MNNSSFEDIFVSGMANCAFATDHRPHQDGGVRMENVLVDRVFVKSDRKSFTLLKFDTMREGDGFKNVSVKRVSGAEPVEKEGIKYE